MARVAKIIFFVVFCLLIAHQVRAVVYQSLPPGLEVFNFITDASEQTVNGKIINDPEVQFFLAQRSGGIVSSLKHYIKGLYLLQNNPWYLLNSIWFVFLTMGLGLALAVLALSLVNLGEFYPVFVHTIKENRLMGLLLVLPLAGLFGLKYLILSLVFLSFYISKDTKKDRPVILMVLLFAGVLFVSFVLNCISLASTKQFRQMVNVNTGYQLTPAEALKDSKNFKERFSYVLSLQVSGDLQGAINEYKRFLEEFPDGRTFINLGNCYFMLGNIPEARTAYQEAIKRGVTFSGYYNLSVLERESLNFQKADEYFQKASKIDIDRITSLKDTGLYGPMVLNEYLSPLEIAMDVVKGGLKGLISRGNIIFAMIVLLGVLGGSFLSGKIEGIRVCPKCGNVFCPKCERISTDRRICSLCFKTLVAVGLPLEKRVAHLVASQQYRAQRRRFLFIESLVLPWFVFVVQRKGSWGSAIVGWLMCMCISGFLVARVFSFNTVTFLNPLGNLFLGLGVIIYIAGAYLGYRIYSSGGS